MNKKIDSIRKKAIPVLKKYNVKKAGIFGSYARGNYKRNSDIDILIQPPKKLGLGFIDIKTELEEKLKKKVDLVTYKSINIHLKKDILESEIRII